MYSCTIEMSMVASHLIWLLRTRNLRKIANEVGQTFDENSECVDWQAEGIDLEGAFLRLFSKTDRTGDDSDRGDNFPSSPVEPQHVPQKTVPVVVV